MRRLRFEVLESRTLLAAVSFAEFDKLIASDAAPGNNFGTSVAVSADGNTFVVSSQFDNEADDNAGASHVYMRDASSFTFLEQTLTASDAFAADNFGHAVAISADGLTVVVGAPDANALGADSGAAYVYQWDSLNSTFVELVKLTASDGGFQDRFGWSVAVSADGETVVVGARGDDHAGLVTGSAYVYRYDDLSAMFVEQKLTASDAAAGDQFGWSVAVSADGETVLVGSPFDDDAGGSSGSAYVYQYDALGATFLEQQKLIANDGQAGDEFGYSLAVSASSETVAIGARRDDDAGNNAGSAYLFEFDALDSVFVQQEKFIASDGAADDEFGWSISVSASGDTLVVGATFDDNLQIGSGSAYVYQYDALNSIFLEQKVTASDAGLLHGFGSSLSISADGNTVVVGAPFDDDAGTTSGSVYLFIPALVITTADDELDAVFDATDLSLREAVAIANTTAGADWITFDPTMFTATGGVPFKPVLLTMGEMALTESVKIVGLGAEFTAINAQNLSRVFNITATTGDFTLEGLTLMGGRTTGANAPFLDTTYSGGAIRSMTSGNLTLGRCVISGNATSGDYARGGAVHAQGDVALNRSTISGNRTSGKDAHGGGIYADGVTLHESIVFYNNTDGPGASGGGIFARYGAALSRSTVSENALFGSGLFPFGGGGIYAGDVTLTNSTVSGNVTFGQAAGGGGIRARYTVTLNESTISGNSTVGDFAPGGGILAQDVVVNRSTVTGNSTSTFGVGGIITSNATTIDGSIVARNFAGGNYSDLAPGAGPLTVRFSLIGSNSGVPLAPAPVGSPDANGNLIGTPSSPIDPMFAPLDDNGGRTMTHLLTLDSPAFNTGDPGFVPPPEFDQRGNGFSRVQYRRIDMGAIEFDDVIPPNFVVDIADDEDDGDYAPGDLSLREAIVWCNSYSEQHTITFAPHLDGATILLTMGELPISQAMSIDASGLENGITIDASGNDPTPDSTIEDGDDLNDGDGSRVFNVDNFDGGIDIEVTFSSLTIAGGDTSGDGGGIFNRENLTLLESKISGNIAVRGGGVYTSYGSLTLMRCIVEENTSQSYGGGLVVRDTQLHVIDSMITGNSAVSYGGGLDVVSDEFTEIVRSTISYNQLSTTGAGGGLYARTPTGQITITDSTFIGNVAGNGGGMYVEAESAGTITITNSTISGNLAAGAAGGVCVVSDGTVQLFHNTITQNTSDTNTDSQGSGGGLFHLGNGTLTVSHTIIAGNTDNTGAAPDIDLTDPPATQSISFSLIGEGTGSGLAAAPFGSPDVNGNLIGTGVAPIDPLLAPLANNGGSTLTHELLAGSPAINAGDPNIDMPPEFDQRGDGFLRVLGMRIDMGAFERPNERPDVTVPGTQTINEGGLLNLATLVSFTDPDANDTHEVTIGWGDDTPDDVLSNTPIGYIMASHVYADDATYTVTVTITDFSGDSDTDSFNLTVNNVAPTLTVDEPAVTVDEGTSATNSGTFGDVPADTVTLEASIGTVAGNAGAWSWSYNGADDLPTQTVTITASDEDGGSTNVTFNLTVNNVAPTADAGGPYTVNEGGSVTLSASGSDVPGDPLTFAWDLDNNGTFETSGASVLFNAAGLEGLTVVTVAVRVSDGDGGQAIDTAIVTVNNVAPTADAGGPYTVNEGGSVTLSASGSDVPGDPLTFAWDLDNNGTFETSGASVLFDATGLDGLRVVTVAVRVSDGDGGQTIDTATVTVNNVAPSFEAGSNEQLPRRAVAFSRSGIAFTDPGSLDSHNVIVNYGDGSVDQTTTLPVGNRQLSLSHVYTSSGTFTVTVTVEDDDTGRFTDTFSVTVDLNDPPQVDQPIPDQTATQGSPFDFVFAASTFSDPDGDTLSYTAAPSGGGALPMWLSFDATLRRFFGTPGPNVRDPITIRVTANDGEKSVSDDFTLSFVNLPPIVANPIPDQTASEGTPFSFSFAASTFSDPGGDTLVYTTGTLPAWLSFDPALRRFSGTPGSNEAPVTIRVTADDGEATVFDEFMLSVVNALPTIASLSDSPDPVPQGNTLTLTANGVADSDGTVTRVEFYRDTNNNSVLDVGTDQLLGEDTSAADGWTWSGSSGGLPLGTNRYFARAQDNVGAYSNTVTTTGVVQAPPTIASLSDSPDPVPQGNTLTLTANGVADSDGTVTRVEFYRDVNNNSVLDVGTDQLLGEDTSAADGWTWSGSSSILPGGTTRYFARAQDNVGAYSSTVTTTGVVQAPPTITSLSDSPDPVPQGNTLTLTANGVADSDGTVTRVEFYRDANNNSALDVGTDQLLGADTSSTGGWTWSGSSSILPGGTTRYFARAQDNVGAYSNAVTTTGVVQGPPNAPPTIFSLIDSPDPVTQGSTLTLTAIGVADSDGTVMRVEFYRDVNNNSVVDVGTDQLLGEDTSSTGGWTWSGSTSGFPPNTNVYLARAQDNRLDWSSTVAQPGIVQAPPNTPPTITSLSDSPDPVTQGNTLTLTANGVADSDGTVTRVEFYRDVNNNSVVDVGTDQLLGEDTSSTGGWTWSGSTSGFPPNTNVYLARAQDNRLDWSSTVAQPGIVQAPPNTPPTITSLSDSPDPVLRGSTLTLTANGVADSDGTVTRVEFYRDVNNNSVVDVGNDQLLGEDTSAVGGWTWSGSTSGFPLNTNRYLARAQDNQFVWSSSVAATGIVQAPPNTPPTITSLSDSPDPVPQGNTLTLTAIGVADIDGTVTRVEFYRDVNNNSVVDVGTDQLLGQDTSSSGGWTWSGATSGFPLNTNRYLARAQDDLGALSNTVTTTGVVQAPPPIVANPIPNQTATEGTPFSFSFAANTFSDPDGDTLVYTTGTLPAWLSFDPALRRFSGTPSSNEGPPVTIRVTADDGEATVFDEFVLTVANPPPIVANPIPNQTATQGSPFDFVFAANTFSDPDGDTLVYTTGALPTWLSFDAALRRFSGTPRSNEGPPITIRVTANDGEASVFDEFVLTFANPPPIVANPIPDQTATQGSPFDFVFAANTFSDPDGDTLSYTAAPSGGGALPMWLSFDATLRRFFGTPGPNVRDPITIRVTANDGEKSVSDDFTLSFVNLPPIVANPIPDQTASEGTPFSFSFAASTFSDPGGDTLVYTTGTLPAWLSFDPALRRFSGTPGSNEAPVTIRVTADDGEATVFDEFMLSVVNALPTVANPIPNQTATEGTPFSFSFAANTFSDPDGDTLVYTTGTLPAWLSFDPALRRFSGTPSSNEGPPVTIRVTADDGEATVFDEFVLTVANPPPIVANPIPNQTATQGSPFDFVFAANTFSDPDGDTLVYTTGALPTWLSFDAALRRFSGTPRSNEGPPITIRVTANDGEASVFDEFVLTFANPPPIVANPIPDQTATQGSPFDFVFAANTFSDPDGDTLSYTAAPSGGGALPMWLSFDATLRRFFGTPGPNVRDPITIRVTANDGEKSVSDDFTLSFVNLPPIVANPIPDQTASEGTPFSFSFAASTFSDPGGDTLVYTTGTLPAWLSFDPALRRFSGTPGSNEAPVTIRVTADDGEATVFDEFMLSVVNALPTVANPIPNQTATEGTPFSFSFAANTFSDPDGDTLVYTTGTLPAWLSFDAALRRFSGTPSSNEGPPVTIRVTADDGEATVFDEFVLTVANPPPIVANPIPNQTATEGTPFSFSFAANTFSDPDGDTLVYTASRSNKSALPAWLSFDAALRRFSGTPRSNEGPPITIRVTANDGEASVFDEFVLTFANPPPIVANPIPDQTATQGSPFDFVFAASTFSDPDGDTLSYTAAPSGGGALPMWLSFDATLRRFFGTPGPNVRDPITIRVTANDGEKSVSDDFTLSFVNLPPIVANPIPDQTASEGTPFSFSFAASTFSDPGGDTLVYTTGTLPAWLSFDPALRRFSGTPGSNEAPVTIRVTADDGEATVFDEFMLSVVNALPIVANPIPDQTASEGTPFSFSFAASTFSDPGGDTLVYTTGTLPAWLSFDPALRRFSGTPGSNEAPVTIRVTADDGEATVFDEFMLSVVNALPTVANPIPNQTATEGTPFSFSFAANTFSDPDGDTLVYTTGTLPAWLSFDPALRRFSGTPSSNEGPPVTIRVTADDGEATVFDEFVLTVANPPPIVANPIPNQTATEGTPFSFSFAANTFSDPDGDTLVYTTGALPAWLSFDAALRRFSGTPSSNEGPPVTIRVTADDGEATVFDEFMLSVVNATPEINVPGPQTINVGSTLELGTLVSFADPGALTTPRVTINWGDGTPALILAEAPVGFIATSHLYNTSGTFTVTITVLDDIGASSIKSFTLTVNAIVVDTEPSEPIFGIPNTATIVPPIQPAQNVVLPAPNFVTTLFNPPESDGGAGGGIPAGASDGSDTPKPIRVPIALYEELLEPHGARREEIIDAVYSLGEFELDSLVGFDMGDEPVPPKKKVVERQTKRAVPQEHVAEKPADVGTAAFEDKEISLSPLTLWSALAGGGTLWLGGAWWWHGQKRRRRSQSAHNGPRKSTSN